MECDTTTSSPASPAAATQSGPGHHATADAGGQWVVGAAYAVRFLDHAENSIPIVTEVAGWLREITPECVAITVWRTPGSDVDVAGTTWFGIVRGAIVGCVRLDRGDE